MPVHLLVARSLWLMLPAYLANMGATVVGGGPPADGGRTWSDGRRILGDGKTWGGFVFSPLLSVILTALLRPLAGVDPLARWGVSTWGPTPGWIGLAYGLALGALVGDAAFSFLKRRVGKERGAPWPGVDQLDFVLGGLLGGLVGGSLASIVDPAAGNPFLADFTLPVVAVVVVVTPALHVLVNYIGWRIGVKDVPW
jgi:CDP-2,3-bis-(O-geranylgeranyl)-sn-glycerol synthase